MILNFAKRTLQPGVAALVIQGSMHTGPDCARLQREVDAIIAAHETRVIFDMAGVTHADSAAIGAIVKCLSKLKSAGGALRITGAQPMLVHSFKLTKIDLLIEMFPTVEQAIKEFPVPGANPAHPY